jgi:hypothetical protein
MKHQLDATLCRFYFCRVTLHVPALIRRCDDLPATIKHVPVAAVLVSFELYYDARKHKIKICGVLEQSKFNLHKQEPFLRSQGFLTQ